MTESSAAAAVDAPFREQLLASVRREETGRLDCFASGEEVGSVVLVEGRVAWASCRYQPENLGSFLKRLGHVTSDQLAAANEVFKEHSGQRKLGKILEDSGVVSRAVLRRCLQLHVRMALSCLLRDDRLTGMWTAGDFTSDDEMLFFLDEVFPELQRAFHAGDAGEPELFVSEFLDEVALTPGYQSSVVADSWGTALGIHGDAVDEPLLASVLATAAATVVESGRNAAKRSGLGDLNFIMIEGENGSATIRWADREKGYLVAVFLDAEGQTGVARHRITSCAEKIQRAVSEINSLE